jgi:peptide-methionine (S)-S-oxide reductase
MTGRTATLLALAAIGWLAVNAGNRNEGQKAMNEPKGQNTDFAVLAGGCFWCVEAVYQRIDGVISVMPGYAGGDVPNPTYEQVCTGKTGHAESARIEFDPAKVSYAQILETFWKAHDPTTLNRQGNDVGTQYRSAIFYRNDEQKQIAEQSKRAAQAAFTDPIVTEIAPLKTFYPAEDYHREYYEHHKGAPYCQFVIAPKLKKLHLEEKQPVTK